jgi:hypothetical protein
MAGGGHLEYFTALSAIYPVIGVALVVESRLSYTSGFQELVKRRGEDLTTSDKKAIVAASAPVAIGLAAGVAGEYAALGALHDGAATRWQFDVADAALVLMGGVLAFLLAERVLIIFSDTVAWILKGALILALVIVWWIGLDQ